MVPIGRFMSAIQQNPYTEPGSATTPQEERQAKQFASALLMPAPLVEQAAKVRETVEYLAADSLQNYVTRLYRAAGFGRGFSSHSGRQTFASRLVAQGHSIETVQLLLGHVHLDHVAPYLEVSKQARHEAMADLSGVFSDA
jgi:site-specific recombinase XerD